MIRGKAHIIEAFNSTMAKSYAICKGLMAANEGRRKINWEHTGNSALEAQQRFKAIIDIIDSGEFTVYYWGTVNGEGTERKSAQHSPGIEFTILPVESNNAAVISAPAPYFDIKAEIAAAVSHANELAKLNMEIFILQQKLKDKAKEKAPNPLLEKGLAAAIGLAEKFMVMEKQPNKPTAIANAQGYTENPKKEPMQQEQPAEKTKQQTQEELDNRLYKALNDIEKNGFEGDSMEMLETLELIGKNITPAKVVMLKAFVSSGSTESN